MMELLKKHIHMNRRRGNVTSQMTLDDDFNVPDSMDDVEELIMENGEVKIDSVKNPGEKAEVSGKLEFRILYRRPGGELTALAGSIPFTETVHMPGLSENDYVQAGWELDDLNVSLINSRKLNVKALVTLNLRADEIRDMEAASDAKFDGEVEVLKKTLTVAAIAVRRRDTFRVREVLSIPGNNPDAETLLWQDMRLQDVETKPLDGKTHINGDLLVFAVYSAGGGQMPVQCFEETVPFSGDVELTESAEDMIPFITVKLVHRDLELQPDADGEMREIAVDAVMELDIRLYEEEEVELLSDLYALDREVIPETGTACFDTLAVRNQVRTKIQEKIQLTGRQRILQMCHADGDVKIDEVQIREDGIHMDGVLVTPTCCDPLHRRAVRVSMGTVFQIPWTYIGARSADWPQPGLARLRALGFQTAAMAEALSIEDSRLVSAEKLAIVLGTEGDGLSPRTVAHCDYTVCIPMARGVDSLNVAAASAVAFWQLGRYK